MITLLKNDIKFNRRTLTIQCSIYLSVCLPVCFTRSISLSQSVLDFKTTSFRKQPVPSLCATVYIVLTSKIGNERKRCYKACSTLFKTRIEVEIMHIRLINIIYIYILYIIHL